MMIKILNASEELLGVIDDYKSVIWSRRYSECGDFELYCRATDETLALLRSGNFVERDDDDQICIIENIRIETDVDNGNYIIATGRCTKSILDRRIVWFQTTLYAQIETFIQMILDEHLINPISAVRAIPNFAFINTGTFTDYIEKQMDGEELLDVIVAVCKQYNYGFEITLTNGYYTMQLYQGTDRSYSQNTNPYVVFSVDFDNLPQSNYQFENASYKNVALVEGEGSGTERLRYVIGSATGLERREVYTDASAISQNNGAISDNSYYALLAAEGEKTLASSKGAENFDGTVIPNEQWQYKRDYFVGDVVQIKNEYGVSASARIIEVMETFDDTGYTIIPTFSTWEVSQ